MTLPVAHMSIGNLPDARSRTEREQRVTEVATPTGARATCHVCPHAMVGHDAISSRFCTATFNGALTRGCICRSS